MLFLLVVARPFKYGPISSRKCLSFLFSFFQYWHPRGTRDQGESSSLPNIIRKMFHAICAKVALQIDHLIFLIQKSVIHLVQYDRYEFMTFPIHICRHSRTVIGCIGGLAASNRYESGFPHIEFDSIQPGSVSSQWVKTMIHDQEAAQSCQSAEHSTHVRLTRPPIFRPFEKLASKLPDDSPFKWKLGVADDNPPRKPCAGDSG